VRGANAKLPPGPRFAPAIQAIAWTRRPLPFLERCQKHFGDTFTIRVRHAGTWVILADPRDVKNVFTADHSVLGVGLTNWMHRNPDVYPEPLAFRPERFLEKPAGTYRWIPFGGGVRRCLAASYADADKARGRDRGRRGRHSVSLPRRSVSSRLSSRQSV
jgi:cytochrome P450